MKKFKLVVALLTLLGLTGFFAMTASETRAQLQTCSTVMDCTGSAGFYSVVCGSYTFFGDTGPGPAVCSSRCVIGDPIDGDSMCQTIVGTDLCCDTSDQGLGGQGHCTFFGAPGGPDGTCDPFATTPEDEVIAVVTESVELATELEADYTETPKAQKKAAVVTETLFEAKALVEMAKAMTALKDNEQPESFYARIMSWLVRPAYAVTQDSLYHKAIAKIYGAAAVAGVSSQLDHSTLDRSSLDILLARISSWFVKPAFADNMCIYTVGGVSYLTGCGQLVLYMNEAKGIIQGILKD